MLNKNDDVLTQGQLDYISNEDYINEYQGNLPCCDRVEPVAFSSKNASIYMFGKPVDWREDFYFHTQIIELLMKEKISKIFFPDISNFTGEICEENDFTQFSFIEKYGLKVFKNKKTEGLIIPKNAAVLFCTADCPTVVYHDFINDLFIAFHAGLGSIIDKQMILTGRCSRWSNSVIDDVVEYIDCSVNKNKDYEILIFGGIKHESFVYSPYDSIYGESNKKLLNFLVGVFGTEAVPLGLEHGGISIQNIIRKQFTDNGFDFEKIHIGEINTFTDSRFWSHTRFVQKKEKKDGRNGILIINK